VNAVFRASQALKDYPDSQGFRDPQVSVGWKWCRSIVGLKLQPVLTWRLNVRPENRFSEAAL
jgi:hypothetical protein